MSRSVLAKKIKELDLKFTHEELADKLECSRNTMYKRFISGDWKNSQKKTLKKLGLL